MSYRYIQTPEALEPLRHDLDRSDRFALDCEAAGFHRYSDRLCLVQLSTASETYLLDPFEVDIASVLKVPLEDPEWPTVMHGSDFDLRLLQRDLGIRLRGLSDTQIAAQLLGEESIGLAAQIEAKFGVKLSKKYQRADWAERPLSDGMLAYAASDTSHLLPLADIFADALERAGRTSWFEEECRALEDAAGAPAPASEPEDPVVRVKGARHLSPRQVTALRAALEWRDEIARSRDRATFRVVSDGPLVEAVAARPRSVGELSELKGFPARLAQDDGQELLRRLDEVSRLPEEALQGYPKPARRGPGRPTPETEALADRLKEIRNRRADEIGLPRGTLLPNAVVLEVARLMPDTPDALRSVDGMREWKMKLLGDDFLAAVRAF